MTNKTLPEMRERKRGIKTLEESYNLDREEILFGFIKEMGNYGYVEEYIGKYIAQIIHCLEIIR